MADVTNAAARDDADHRSHPDRQHSLAQRVRRGGTELSVPVHGLDRLGYAGFVGCEYHPRGTTTDVSAGFKRYAGSKTVDPGAGCLPTTYYGASDLANTRDPMRDATVQTIACRPAISRCRTSTRWWSRSRAGRFESGPCGDRLGAAEQWLRPPRRRAIVLFKICSLPTFPSRCRQYRSGHGCAAAPIPAMRSTGDPGLFPAPAAPFTRANLFVGSVPAQRKSAEGSSAQPDARFPTWCGCCRARAGPGSDWSISPVLARGPDAVRARLAELGANGIGAAIVDAVFDRDLETIGTVALDYRLSVGAFRHRTGPRPRAADGATSRSVASSPVSDAAVGGAAACSPAAVRRRRCSRWPAPNGSCRCCTSIRSRSS